MPKLVQKLVGIEPDTFNDLKKICERSRIGMNAFICKTFIKTWRQEYNHERPKKALGGLTPAAYARQLI